LNNIIYFTNGTLFAGYWGVSTTAPVREYFFDYNLYFSPNPQENYTYPDGNFQQWQSSGQDVHSLIQQDPLFINADAFNFTLQSNSPAFKLGFNQINTAIIGPKSNNGFNIPAEWRGPLSKF